MEVTNTQVAEAINQWKGRIRNVAVMTVRKCIDPIYDVDEIEQRLRIAIWRALEKWDPRGGASQSSWIFGQINQAAALTVEEQYHHYKDWRGNRVHMLEIDTDLEDDPNGEDIVNGLQIPDPFAIDKITSIEGREEANRLQKQIRSIMREGRELTIYDKLISGEYETDMEIANELEIDFAIVGEVRFKAKITLAILCCIPFEIFTRAKNTRQVAEQVAHTMNFTAEEWNERVEPLLLQ